jgi:hypothetical protein
MSWKNTQQNSFADSLVIEHKSLSELDDVHNIINFYQISFYGFRQIHIKPNIIHFVSCACCGGKATLLFMGVVSYLAITRFYPMAIKQPMALKP